MAALRGLRHAGAWPAALLLLGPAASASEKPQSSSGRMTDAQAASLAEALLRTEDPKVLADGLKRLKAHVFRSSRAPERESVLFAQGMALWKLHGPLEASEPLKKLESTFPKSPYLGEAQLPLAEEALERKRLKETETRLRACLDSDIPGERKRRAQELLLWLLVETDRPAEGLPVLDTLRPLSKGEKPTERGLAAMVLILCQADRREQAEANRKSFRNLFAQGPLLPRVDLAWARMLGRTQDVRGSAQAFRKLITDHPKSAEADEARLALATLLTDGSLKAKDLKGMPDAENLLAELRKSGSPKDEALAGVVELRILYRKELWEEILNGAEAWEKAHLHDAEPSHLAEVQRVWKDAWGLWVASRLEKGYAGHLLERLRPGAFAALDAPLRKGVVELITRQGLAVEVPKLLKEAPAAERGALTAAALGLLEPEAQPQGALALLPARGTPAQELTRLRALTALRDWKAVRLVAARAQPGPERIRCLVALLERPHLQGETASQRRTEAESWLARLPEKPDVKEPFLIRAADLRLQGGDARGALALYPAKPSPGQLGWVSLMRAQAQVQLGQTEAAKATLQAAKGADGFRGQREAMERRLGI